MTRTGIIGLGTIGGGIAECLARVGMLAAVYDIRPGIAETLEGVPPASASPLDVARESDVVIIAVVTAEQTIDVLSGPDGILAAARPELNVVLVATVSLEALGRVRALTDAANVGLIDCGVTGGLKVRENGLVCLVGADENRFAAVKPVLEGFARSVVHMGGPNAGMVGKIARNVVGYGCLRAGYEGAMLARASGLDVRRLLQVIQDSADAGGPMLFMAQRATDPLTDPEEARWREDILGFIYKDIEAALELGEAVAVDLPLLELVRDSGRVTLGLPK